jgi:glyoxylase I family protein
MHGLSPPPFVIGGIDHVLLTVNDMEAALAFYERVIGAQLEARLPKYGMAELRAGASHIDLVDANAPEGAWALSPASGGRNLEHFALRIDGCDQAALRHHLAAHSVAIVEERGDDEPGGKSTSFYIRDPAGNTVELMGIRG